MRKIKNIKEAAERIKRAVENKEKIVLYGDADMDGTSSVVILEEIIKEIGGQPFYIYFPDRDKEGYGLNNPALSIIKEKIGDDKALLIVVDCGIANFEEATRAKELGMEVIIIDHHQPHSSLPSASIIVNPKQEGDEYPFKDFANTGLILMLAEEITGKRKSFIELAALATISDMMIQENDNKEIIDEGLEVLLKTEREGLRAFWRLELVNEDMTIRDIAQKITSILGVSHIISHKTEAYTILTSKDNKEIDSLIKGLVKRDKEKQDTILQMIEEVKEKSTDDVVIFQGNSNWKMPLLGSAASKIENELKKPVFLYKLGKETSRGAVRVPKGVNAVDVMEKSSDILIAYGGHPPAAGFSIKNENIEEFKKRLKNHFTI